MLDFDRNDDRNHSDDRIFVLEPMAGKGTLSSTGLVDNRLLKGGNNLRAIKDPQNGSIWMFKYDSGALPEPLKQKFTSFTKLKQFAEEYLGRRNIQIKEILG